MKTSHKAAAALVGVIALGAMISSAGARGIAGGGFRGGGGGGFRGGGGFGGGGFGGARGFGGGGAMRSPGFSAPRNYGGGMAGGMRGGMGGMNMGNRAGGMGGMNAGGNRLGGIGGGGLDGRAGLGGRGGIGGDNPFNRPGGGNLGNRTNIGGGNNLGNRTNIGGGNNLGNRTNIGGGNNIGNRTNIGGGNNLGNRTNIGNNLGNRTNIGNNININNGNINFNRNTNIGNNIGRNGAWGYHPGWGYHPWVNGYWHGHWNNSNWLWGAGAVAGLSSWAWGSTLWAWGYAPYVNPYIVTQPVVVEQPVVVPTFDYSQPISTTGSAPPEAQSDPAIELFDQARAVFKAGDYAKALDLVNQVIKSLPNDTTAHEFRALCLFALKRYDEAAAPLYAVLSVGPGWDWTTLVGLYDSVETYSKQLRDLEAATRSRPDSPAERFVLAYHYLTQGHTAEAAQQFRVAARLQPSDKLAITLANSFDPEEAKKSEAAASTPPAPEETPKSAIPSPDASAILGAWKASPQAGTDITLTLQQGNKFTWSVSNQGKAQSFGGDYTYGDDLLTLLQPDGPALVGRLSWAAKDRFSFKIAGGPPNDSGLNFSR